MGYASDSSVAIEVGSYAHMLYAHNADGVIEVLYGIEDTGLAGGGVEKAFVESNLHDSATVCKCLHLLVVEVAWVRTQSLAAGVAAYDGGGGDVEGIVEAVDRCMVVLPVCFVADRGLQP